MKKNFDASQFIVETQQGKEQVAIAAVVSISEGLLCCEGNPALSQPGEGCGLPNPTPVGERMNSMFKNSEVSELVLTGLLKEAVKSVFDLHSAAIVEGASGRELVVTGCIIGDDEAESFSFRKRLENEAEGNVHFLIKELGLPEQPPVPEYDHNDFLDLVAVVTGLDTSEVEAVDTTDDAVMVMYRALPDVSKVSGDAITVMQLSLCGVPLEDLSESELWTLFYTLEHHGEFHALCTLYRIYELAA